MHTLKRTDFRPDGIFGEFTFDGDPGRFCVTLEHAYEADSNDIHYELDDVSCLFLPKVRSGVYTCVRGQHRLAATLPYFSTFEITGVQGHSGILFHCGNYNKDSSGCVLIGQSITINVSSGQEMITGSRDEFKQWLERLDGVDTFQLEVV